MTAQSLPDRMVSDADFLRDLAGRLFRTGTPAMGFDQHDTSELYRIAHNLSASPLTAQSLPAAEEPDCYDAGLLSDFGGGNVEWWQDYMRSELARAHDFYVAQWPHTAPTDVREAPTACHTGDEREAVARIIDPEAWQDLTGEDVYPAMLKRVAERKEASLTKADAILARQPAAVDREEWQDISTAPKDGTAIDLWGDDLGRMTDCYWGRPSHDCGEMGQHCDGDWHTDDRESWVDGTFNERLSDTFLTHWRPRPAPPRALKAEQTQPDEREGL